MLTSLLETPLGRRAREWTHFWCFKAINPKFDPMMDKSRKPFEVWYKPVPPVRSHRGCQKCTRSHPWHFLSLPFDRTWPSRQHMSFWHYSWLSDMKMSPKNIFKSKLGCVHWIEHVLSFNLSQRTASKSKKWLQTVIFRDCVVHQILLEHHLPYLLLPFSGPPPPPMAFWDFHVTTYSRGMIPSFLDSLCMISAPSRQFC